MGFMDELKKIIHPYDDEDYDYEDDFEEPSRDSRSPFDDRKEDRRSEERRADDRHNKVVNIHATTQLKVVLVKPERFENASEIADHLKEKRTVVLNLESTNKDVARRLIDFLSGVAYAGEGKIKKVAANTYIITPYSVDIMGDHRAFCKGLSTNVKYAGYNRNRPAAETVLVEQQRTRACLGHLPPERLKLHTLKAYVVDV